MTAKWTRILICLCACVTCVVSGFIIAMYFHRDRHWTPVRFGGFPVMLACVPICATSYVVSAYYLTFYWVQPRLFPRLRSRFPSTRRTDQH